MLFTGQTVNKEYYVEVLRVISRSLIGECIIPLQRCSQCILQLQPTRQKSFEVVCSGRDSVRRGQHSSNRVSGISSRTMHQSTTPSLSQTIWLRWASRQFLSLPKDQTFLPVTFGYSLSSQAVVMRELRRWKRLWQRSSTRSHKRTSMWPSRSCWKGTTSAFQPEEITSKGTKV